MWYMQAHFSSSGTVVACTVQELLELRVQLFVNPLPNYFYQAKRAYRCQQTVLQKSNKPMDGPSDLVW